jgi:WD40 repeat protein
MCARGRRGSPRHSVSCKYAQASFRAIFYVIPLQHASEDLRLRIWDTRIGVSSAACEFVGHNNIITCCDVAPHGEDYYFCSSSNGFDGAGCEVMIWDRRVTSKPLHACRGHTETVSGCCFIEDKGLGYVVSVSADCSLRVWSCVDGTCQVVCALPQDKRTMCCAVLPRVNPSNSTPNTVLLATGCVDGSLYEWNVACEQSVGETHAVHVLPRTNTMGGRSGVAVEPLSKTADVGSSYSSTAAAAAIEHSK